MQKKSATDAQMGHKIAPDGRNSIKASYAGCFFDSAVHRGRFMMREIEQYVTDSGLT